MMEDGTQCYKHFVINKQVGKYIILVQLNI